MIAPCEVEECVDDDFASFVAALQAVESLCPRWSARCASAGWGGSVPSRPCARSRRAACARPACVAGLARVVAGFEVHRDLVEHQADDAVVGIQGDLFELGEGPEPDPLVATGPGGGRRAGALGDALVGAAEPQRPVPGITYAADGGTAIARETDVSLPWTKTTEVPRDYSFISVSAQNAGSGATPAESPRRRSRPRDHVLRPLRHRLLLRPRQRVLTPAGASFTFLGRV
jgi:hypothetical protein